ncbi:MAG: putative lipid II flippase FtsW [Dehalococcoidia bacterium]|jgi:cell division protein FtsW|nr:MAG: cell division protein FtsW [Chloroflexota bacterium]
MNNLSYQSYSFSQLLITVVLMLLIIGTVSIYSASYAIGYLEYQDSYFFLKRHLIYTGLGLSSMYIFSKFDYRLLARLSPLIMILAVILLFLTIEPHTSMEINGAKRWVKIPFIPSFQPSELSKLAIIIYISAWLSSRSDKDIESLPALISFIITIGSVGFLIMLEPDLGTTLLIAAVTGSIFFVAGAKLSHIIALCISSLVSLIMLIAVKGYGLTRIMSFLSAESDPSGAGYQTIQLLIAFGSGGLTGLGLGSSRQKFFYLPASHSDGILAVIGEELGFIGVFLVIILFLVLAWQGLKIANKASDEFGSLLATGISLMIIFQVLLNVGGISRSIPLTGIPLPMISSGGTSTIMTLTAIGILLSIDKKIKRNDKKRKNIIINNIHSNSQKAPRRKK